jgi:UDP-N-acetylglucosamine 2-epimerase (non-hydrolysing)
MKILTITGTRPELIRLSRIIPKLDKILGSNHILIYSNQNYDPNLKDVFFKELGLRYPNYTFPVSNDHFLGDAFKEMDNVLEKEKPDKVLVLGDTNTGLIAMVAAKKRIPIYHMEAGNRSYDIEVPEETNRHIIDSFSTYNLPYTENSKDNLIREGYHKNFVFKTGNPLFEVLNFYEDKINKRVNHTEQYVLVTIHRQENVDNKERAISIALAINRIANNYDIIFPMHPRTKDRFISHGIVGFSDRVKVIDPIGYFSFIHLLKHAKCVITDSGSVPEETTIFSKPCVIVRNFIERQELIELGSVIIAGNKTEDIVRSFNLAIEMHTAWIVPADYQKVNVSDTVINLLLGKHE